MDSVSDSQVLTLYGYLEGSLSADNTYRKAQEALYTEVLKTNPLEALICLVKILDSSNLQVSTLSLLLLKRLLSPDSPDNLWAGVPPETQEAMKTFLWAKAQQATDPKIQELTCEVVGTLACLIISHEGNWNDLLNGIFSSMDAKDANTLSSLLILSSIVPYALNECKQRAETILNCSGACLQHDNLKLRKAAINLLNAFVSRIDSTTSQKFSQLVPEMLKTVQFALNESIMSGNSIITAIRELVESEPKLFKPHLPTLVQLCEFVCNSPNYDTETRNLILDFTVSLAERTPKQVKAVPNLAEVILQKIFTLMVNIDEEVEESWLTPEEGFQEKQDEENSINIDYAKIGRKLVTRLIDSIGDKVMLPPILSIIHSTLNNSQDWRMPYAALLTLSEIISYIAEPDKIADVIPIIQANVVSNNPKLRYASFHLIGQACEDYAEEFQAAHHSTVAPVLISGISDPVPRVSSQCLGAIINFLEGCGHTLGSKYLADIYSKASVYLQGHYPSIIVEQSVTVMGGLAQAVKADFSGYFEQALVLVSGQLEKYQGPIYWKMRGRIVESITIMSKSVPLATFAPMAGSVITVLQNIERGQSDFDSYIMSAWQRICEITKADFARFLPTAMEVAIRVLSIDISVSTSSNPEAFIELQNLITGQKQKSMSTAETENISSAIQAVLTFINELKVDFAAFIDPTVRATVPLISFTANENIRGSAASLLAALVEVKKDIDLPKAIEMSKIFMNSLWEVAEDEILNETLVEQLEAIKTCIETPGTAFLTAEEVNSVGAKALALLDRSLKNRDIPQDSDDEEDEEFKHFQKQEEDNLHTSISDIIGALFKNHKEYSISILQFLYTSVFPRFLDPGASDEDHKFALFIIDDVIEFIGEGLLTDKWSPLCEALVKYAADRSDAVRQAACYGLGIFASRSSATMFSPWSAGILDILNRAITMPPGKRVKTHGHARDNAIAAVGKIIKFQSGAIDLKLIVENWVKLLPLRWDKEEARAIHELLADICIEKPELALGDNNQNFKLVLEIFGDILETKLANEATPAKIRKALEGFDNSLLNQAFNELSDLRRAKLTKLGQ